MMFLNRVDAGRQLGRALSDYTSIGAIVFAIPRGGVVVGAEVANFLNAPMELVIPCKIGHPTAADYAIGAVTEWGKPVWNESELTGISAAWCDKAVENARREAKRRRIKYQGDQTATDVVGRTAIIVDDGIATGYTMLAARNELRERGVGQILVAVPVAPEVLPAAMTSDTAVLALRRPHDFAAVSNYYHKFGQVSDEEVRQLAKSYSLTPESGPLDLEALNAILAAVDKYPVKSGDLAYEARRLHSPANVVSFFESIPQGIQFSDKADVIRRSEEARLIMQEKAGAPDEELRSYD